jgi:EmrB/QacA subfamily drug resistance transporter
VYDASYTTYIAQDGALMNANRRASTRQRGGLAIAGLLAGPFLSMVDSNVVNVAIPQIARSLHASLEAVQWTVSGYLLALGTALAASAFLERRFGSRPVYVFSLATFTLASALCALAPSLPFLIGARILQGLAGAALVPVAMGMLLGPSSETQRQIPITAGILLFLAPAAGPTLGGILITAFGWPSIFLINIPFGIIGVLGVLVLDERTVRPAQAVAPFDAIGLVLLAAGLGLAVYGSGRGPIDGWLSLSAMPYWAAGAALLTVYVVWAHKHAHPALRLTLVKNAQAGLALALSSLAGVVLFAVLFLIPVFLQTVQHLSAFDAGLVLLPQGAVMGVGMGVTQRLVQRGLIRQTTIAGMAVLTVTTATMLLIGNQTPVWLIAVILSGRGLALGLIVQPLLARMLDRIRSHELADANTLFNVGERLSGSFGIALLASLYAVIGFHQTVIVLTLLAGVGTVGSLLVANPNGSASTDVANVEAHETVA